jgi:hypothetical protein
MSTAPAAPDPEASSEAPHRDRIEYMTREVGAPLEPEDLQSIGYSGYELTCILKYGGMLIYHFMRPSRSTPP